MIPVTRYGHELTVGATSSQAELGLRADVPKHVGEDQLRKILERQLIPTAEVSGISCSTQAWGRG